MKKFASALAGLFLMTALAVGAYAEGKSCCDGGSCCNGQTCCKAKLKAK